MDMNQLFHHHQMALIAAARARRDGVPADGSDLPGYYARRIEDYRARRNLPRYFAAPGAR